MFVRIGLDWIWSCICAKISYICVKCAVYWTTAHNTNQWLRIHIEIIIWCVTRRSTFTSLMSVRIENVYHHHYRSSAGSFLFWFWFWFVLFNSTQLNISFPPHSDLNRFFLLSLEFSDIFNFIHRPDICKMCLRFLIRYVLVCIKLFRREHHSNGADENNRQIL